MQSASLLLISPLTYNYHSLILDSCHNNNISVQWLNERPSCNLFFKILSRFLNPFARLLSLPWYIHKVDSLFRVGFCPDFLLVIKGESVHPHVISYIKRKFPNCICSLYFWDSTDNLPGYSALSRSFSNVFSFDSFDCRAHAWSYRPLFAGNAISSLKSEKTDLPLDSQYDWSFVGAVHSDRLYVLDELSRQSCSYFMHLYFPSPLHCLLYCLRYPKQSIRLRTFFSLAPLLPSELISVYESSRCIVDISHPNQSGLTMRTLESVLSSRKIFTTNSAVRRERFYDETRVAIFSRQSPRWSEAFLDVPFKSLCTNVADFYSVDCWLATLIGTPRSPRL